MFLKGAIGDEDHCGRGQVRTVHGVAKRTPCDERTRTIFNSDAFRINAAPSISLACKPQLTWPFLLAVSLVS